MTTVKDRVKRVSPIGNSQNITTDESSRDAGMTEMDGEMGETMEEPIIKTVKDPGCPSREEVERRQMQRRLEGRRCGYLPGQGGYAKTALGPDREPGTERR